MADNSSFRDEAIDVMRDVYSLRCVLEAFTPQNSSSTRLRKSMIKSRLYSLQNRSALSADECNASYTDEDCVVKEKCPAACRKSLNAALLSA